MFWKLCKFEWKCSYRSFIFLYAVVLISSLFMNFGNRIDLSNSAMNFTAGLVTMIYGISLSTLCIMAFVNVIRTYYQSMFKRTSYLTHTLPVPSWMLVLSKILAGMFWIILSFFVCMISMILIALNFSDVNLSDIIGASGRILSYFSIFDCIRFIFMVLISVGETVALFYFVMTAANTKYIQRYRSVAAVLIFFAILIVEGIIGNSFTHQILFSSLQINMMLSINTSSIFSMLMSLFMTGVWFFGNVYLLEHKMEIE